MKLTKFIIISIAATLLSCGDKLEIEPLNSVGSGRALSTSADVEALLVGAYWAIGDGDVYGGNILRDAELMGDDGEVAWDGTFVAPGEIWDKNMLITNDQARETWLESYRVINMANTVLANLELVTSDKKERVEGEAKFLRGATYFELVRLFGKTWTDGSPSSNPGVPLILEPTRPEDVDVKVTRNTVAEIYTQVIDDLTDGLTLLPVRNGFFATRFSASAILSRVYLMQNDYASALTAANFVITDGGFDLTTLVADAFGKTSTQATNRSSNGNATPEDVFAVQVTSQAGVNSLWNFFDPAGRGDIPIEDAHIALYEAGDARLNLFATSGGIRYTTKFNNRFGNVSIVRLAEMYLTRAECNFRLSSAVGDTPLNDINRIRGRVTLMPLIVLTLDEILLERRKELAFEGHLLHDLKRTQRAVGALPFNSPKLVFPIPQRETLLNVDLQQNESY